MGTLQPVAKGRAYGNAQDPRTGGHRKRVAAAEVAQFERKLGAVFQIPELRVLGPNDLFRRTVAPNDRDVRYMFGGGDYKMKEYTAWLKFIYQGQTAWETVSSNVPGVISLKQGENVGQKLREFEKPNYAFFEQVELPKFLQKPTPGPGTGPGGSLTLGKSRVTTGGLQ